MYAELLMVATASGCVIEGSRRSVSARKFVKHANGGEIPEVSPQSALMLPFLASFSLIFLYFFFNAIETLVVLYIAFTATASIALLVWPAVSWAFKMQSSQFVQGFSTCIALCVVFAWMYTGHWILNDCLGVAICITMIMVVRIPSLKVATICLSALFLYDVSVWVWFGAFVLRV
jgi:signal peptide peptidase-like protein 3